ncbi:MAG: hypothetical protein COC01_06820 [Bacteroidetes bacterium]|nr:MAG: hypothetical protein COC01_06820 [Bacteroidota bacterium]
MNTLKLSEEQKVLINRLIADNNDLLMDLLRESLTRNVSNIIEECYMDSIDLSKDAFKSDDFKLLVVKTFLKLNSKSFTAYAEIQGWTK